MRFTVRRLVLAALTLGALGALSAGLTLGLQAQGSQEPDQQQTVSEEDEYTWPPEQQRQRDLAIEQRDPSLLPECTEEYFAWRDRAKARGLTHDQPTSLDVWSDPGCKGGPDEEVRGPKSGPGPALGPRLDVPFLGAVRVGSVEDAQARVSFEIPLPSKLEGEWAPASIWAPDTNRTYGPEQIWIAFENGVECRPQSQAGFQSNS